MIQPEMLGATGATTSRVLLVEDDLALATVVAGGLVEQGFHTTLAHTYSDGLSRARSEPFDVVVLDILLPGGSGLDLCRTLRSEQIHTAVLMLTARDEVDDRVHGLTVGADDYLTKPFAFRELVARINALCRRQALRAADMIRIVDLEIDRHERRIRRGGRHIELTRKEFALVELLAQQRGAVIDRATIAARVWDGPDDTPTNLIDVLMKSLCRKIDNGFDLKLIHTIRGVGYRLDA